MADRETNEPAVPVMLLVAVLMAGMVTWVTWLGLAQEAEQARSVALLLSGGYACAVGLLLVVRSAGALRTDPSRVVLSCGVVAWGIGQVLLGLDSLDGQLGYPLAGDLISGLAAPIALAAVMLAPRRPALRNAGLRLGLDAAAAAMALTYGLWRVTGGQLAAPMIGSPLGTLIAVLIELTVVAMVVLAAVQDMRSPLWLSAVGVTAQAGSDLIMMLNLQPTGERPVPWPAGVLTCIAWPLIGLGLMRYRTRIEELEGIEERRDASAATLATTMMAAALICGVLLGFPSLPDLDRSASGSLILILVLAPVLFFRDTLGARVRLQLFAGLREQAFRDALTGLPNRGAFTRQIASLDDSGDWVVLTLNLDGFKRVNDLLGAAAGDQLLIAVAEQIRQGAGGRLAARIAGDEFAVLTPGDLDDGRALAQALRTRAAAALATAAPGLDTGLSVGVGKLVRRDKTADNAARDQLSALVESAAALRAAKAKGRGSIEVYAGEVARDHERRIQLEARLARAIRDGVICTFAQPLVRLDSGQLSGFEALARWNDAELGPVSPVEFIEIAEQTGMVVELGEQLLQSAMDDATRAGVFAAGLSVAINASPIQLRVPGFVDAVRYQLARNRVRPNQVTIEVTEAILMADDDPAMRALAELSLLGVSIAIDDFGTGYSALGYLRRLPVQVLKIDKSLTWNLLSEAKTLAIVEGVVRMAHRMGIRVVMEGIETELQADSCRTLGADHGQGWLFGRPVSWTEAAGLVQAAVQQEADRPLLPRPRLAQGRTEDSWPSS